MFFTAHIAKTNLVKIFKKNLYKNDTCRYGNCKIVKYDCEIFIIITVIGAK